MAIHIIVPWDIEVENSACRRQKNLLLRSLGLLVKPTLQISSNHASLSRLEVLAASAVPFAPEA